LIGAGVAGLAGGTAAVTWVGRTWHTGVRLVADLAVFAGRLTTLATTVVGHAFVLEVALLVGATVTVIGTAFTAAGDAQLFFARLSSLSVALIVGGTLGP
jgi:hypothetical protein